MRATARYRDLLVRLEELDAADSEMGDYAREQIARCEAGEPEPWCSNCGVPVSRWQEISCFDGHQHIHAPKVWGHGG